jgi:carboxyl-terminal processing protease
MAGRRLSEWTFGKGSVQVQRELSNGGGLSITIGRWFTPNKTSVNETGIIPDIEVPYSPIEVSGDEDNQLTAAIQVLNGTYQESASEGDTTTQ